MISLTTILTVALYEAKVLLRSWFFRIFSLLALAILVLINVVMFALSQSPWMLRGIPSSIPYINILLLNIVQAVIGVFMASDFLKYDQKVDTTDVIYMRSMTNADYVLGKVLGVLAVFFGLNVAVLIVSGVFNLFFADVPMVPIVYVLYPLYISLPTLVFIFGLSFLFMVIFRNQAITFVVLLGYIAVTLFFLGNKFHYLFDYMAFKVPLMYSDFVGFGDLSTIMIHRGMYFLFGIGFIFTTILLFRRLPQSRAMQVMSLVIALSAFAGGTILGRTYLARLSEGKKLRSEILALDKTEAGKPRVSVKSCAIDLVHDTDAIQAEARLVFTNAGETPIDRYVFSLNPGFEVTAVTGSGGGIPFDRNLHLLMVQPSKPLEPGAVDSLTVVYRGSLVEDACYPDIDEDTREENYRIVFMNIDKRYGFITPDYVLLTYEDLWYPVAGIPYGSAYPVLPPKDFVTFSLSVKTADHLTAISQGAAVLSGPGAFRFAPEVPLPRLSLVIGEYEKRSITVDNVDYELYIKQGHDFFSKYFKALGDGLKDTISRTKRDFEFRLGLDYPYKRLSLIETPIQFFSYPRLWSVAMEIVQPQQVLLPEKGIIMNQADFKSSLMRMSRQSQRGGRTMTAEDMQGNLARMFVSSLTSDVMSRMRMPGLRALNRSFLEMSYSPDFSVFPLFYTFVSHQSSEKWPIFNVALEYYLNSSIQSQMPQFARNITGLSDDERANQILMSQSLAELLADPEKHDELREALSVKCAYLFMLIKGEVGTDEFNTFLVDYLKKHIYTDSKADEFIAALNNEFGFDLEPYFDSWLNAKQLPAFVIADISGFEFFDFDATRYQVLFKVTNLEQASGIISVTFRTGERFGGGARSGGGSGGGGGRSGGEGGGGGGGFFMGGASSVDEHIFFINGGQTKEIGVILDESPRVMVVNTEISQNLPSVFERWFEKLEKNDKAETFDSDHVSDTPAVVSLPGQIIVDNEDPGFKVESVAKESLLKKILARNNDEEENAYVGFQFWRPPSEWKAATSGNAYGLVRRSVHYIKAGKGDNKVSWTADIPESGKYDVFSYVSQAGPQFMRGRREGSIKFTDDFHFFVHNDDGVDEVELDVSNPQEGWNLLGTYFFSKGPAVVELSDLSKGRVVYADALKWVQQK